MVQYSFTSTETRRLVRTDSPGLPPRLSYSSWTMWLTVKQACLWYKIVKTNRGWETRWAWSTCGSILRSGYKIAGTKGECGAGVEMKWVHLRINTRVSCWVVLAVLGRSLIELSSTLGVRLKSCRALFTVKTGLQIKAFQGYVGGHTDLYREKKKKKRTVHVRSSCYYQLIC